MSQKCAVFVTSLAGHGGRWTSVSTIAILSILTGSYEQVRNHAKCNRSPLDNEDARTQMELAARRGTHDHLGGSTLAGGAGRNSAAGGGIATESGRGAAGRGGAGAGPG